MYMYTLGIRPVTAILFTMNIKPQYHLSRTIWELLIKMSLQNLSGTQDKRKSLHNIQQEEKKNKPLNGQVTGRI